MREALFPDVTFGRAARTSMYRRADRYLVAEQALVKPLFYGFQLGAFLKQPWVTDLSYNLLGMTGARFITVDPKMKPGE